MISMWTHKRSARVMIWDEDRRMEQLDESRHDIEVMIDQATTDQSKQATTTSDNKNKQRLPRFKDPYSINFCSSGSEFKLCIFGPSDNFFSSFFRVAKYAPPKAVAQVAKTS